MRTTEINRPEWLPLDDILDIEDFSRLFVMVGGGEIPGLLGLRHRTDPASSDRVMSGRTVSPARPAERAFAKPIHRTQPMPTIDELTADA